MKPCLILSPDYRVLAVVSWKRAATLEFQDKAMVLKHYTDCVKTVRDYYQLPAVLMITRKHIKYFKNKVKLKKKNVFIRDQYKCAYCGNKFKKEDLTVDHVKPISKGGKSTWDNLISSCFPCNRRKGNRIDVKPMWNPYEPKNHNIFIVDRMQPEWKEYLYD